MPYVRLLRLPPQSRDVVGSSCWRRHLSARSSSGFTRVEHGRNASSNAWQHRHLRASNYVLSKAGGNDMPDAAARGVVGKTCREEVAMPLRCVAGGGSGKGNTTGPSATRPTSAAALTAAGRLQTDPAHRAGLLPRSTWGRESLAFRGALGAGWDHGVGGIGLQWQSLRAFASAPPEPAASKTDSPNSKPAAQSGSRPRAFLGDLLKPSDVSTRLSLVYWLCTALLWRPSSSMVVTT